MHDCLPSLLGDEDKGIVYGEEKICFVPGRLNLKQQRQNQKLLYRQDKPTNQPRNDPFICTLWVPMHISFKSQQWPPLSTEPVFVIVYGAQESIPRNRFRQSMWLGGPVRKIGLSYWPARLGIDSWAPQMVYKYGLCTIVSMLQSVKPEIIFTPL